MGIYKLCLGCMEEKGQLNVCPHCGYIEGQSYDSSHLKPGTILNDRYLIGKSIKSNGEGITYIAYDKVIGCRVDVREYMPSNLCERIPDSATINVAQKNLVQYKTLMSEFTELHKKLARMRTLSHISPPLDIFAQNNTTYVVFEHIEGMTFINHLKENAGELSWNDVKKLFPPLFTTLSLIHNAGIIHRGISPETIYYTTDGELKLTGFSVAAARTTPSELKCELFTGYAAPEQYSSSDWQGTWTDVYGICAVLYRILTGCMPVEATSRLVNDNLLEARATNSNVPKNVSKAIMDGMRLVSDARIQTMTDLVTRLFEEPQQTAPAASVKKSEPVKPAAKPHAVQQSTVNTAPKKAAESEIKPKEQQKTTLFEQIKVPVLISCLLLAIVIIIVVLLLPLADELGGESSSSSDSISYSETDANKVDTTTTAVTTVTTATTTTGTVTPSELYTLRDLVGEEYELVATSATSKYVKFIVIEEYSYTVEKGLIISQSVPAEQAIPKGSEVELTVSMGPPVVDIPQYSGKDYTKSVYLSLLLDIGVKEENITFKEYENNGSHIGGTVAFTSLDESGKINLEEGEEIIVYLFKSVETTADNTGDSDDTNNSESQPEDDSQNP